MASTDGASDAAIAPTLQEQGIDVELANWRGVVAPPEISDEGRDCLIALVEQMVASEAWAQTREKYGWQDFVDVRRRVRRLPRRGAGARHGHSD